MLALVVYEFDCNKSQHFYCFVTGEVWRWGGSRGGSGGLVELP